MNPSKLQPRVTVLIPVYKPRMTEYEAISFRQCVKVLGKHRLTLVKPRSLCIDAYLRYSPELLVESFDDRYFRDVKGYNELMLSSAFYGRFVGYDYILIYQLDAFVFKDELLYWCEQGYDYVGAPWLALPLGGVFRQVKRYMARREAYVKNMKREGTDLPVDLQFENKVGNGGFSLRRVDLFYKICNVEGIVIDFYKENCGRHHFFNEDVFWSLEVNRRSVRLKIPDYKKAVGFSMEFHPEYAFRLNKGMLPFGCHAWDLYLPFWRGIFKRLGYEEI